MQKLLQKFIVKSTYRPVQASYDRSALGLEASGFRVEGLGFNMVQS